jgi:DNA-binding beta-propeller fold protein YncE/ABC-type Fe3+ transport system permease subunit
MALAAPIALPSYLLAWCWWQAVHPGSWIGDWAIRHDALLPLRGLCLGIGLLCWGWPLVAWAVAALSRARSDVAAAALLDGAVPLARLRLAWHQDRAALMVGSLAVALLVFGNTTAFDLAQIRSFGFELRVLEARGATASQLIAAAWPALLTGLLGGAAFWHLSTPQREEASAARQVRQGVGVWPWILILVSIGLPVTLMAVRLDLAADLPLFMRLYGTALLNTLAGSIAVGGLAALVAAGLTLRLLSSSPSVRRFAELESVAWCVAAVTPATAIVAAAVLAYNRAFTALLYDSPGAALLGQLALCGAIAALAARHAAAGVPQERVQAIALDGGGLSRGLLLGARPAVVAAAMTAFAIASVLCLGEVVVGARLMPPSMPVLATSILNAVHYQNPETVMLAAMLQVLAALAVAILVVLLWSRLRASRLLGVALLCGWLFALPGCRAERGEATEGEMVLRSTFGNRGDAAGAFDQPRAIAVDAERGHLYVIDKTARVQRFGLDGRFQTEWSMPESARGKPTGVSVGPDGTVWVADTHYHRVMAFDSDGVEVLRFGRYGTGPGEFIYPTDIAIAPEGDIYVAEYGGNDRIQVFSPQAEFRFAFGRFGSGGGEFRRPQAIVFDASGEELYIADSCNHRIVVVDRTGRTLRSFGRAGRAAGELGYPYGLDRLEDGSLLAVEFGSERVQRFSPQGESLAIWGRPGAARGEVRTPWGVAAASSTIFVLDSGNARVQVLELP